MLFQKSKNSKCHLPYSKNSKPKRIQLVKKALPSRCRMILCFLGWDPFTVANHYLPIKRFQRPFCVIHCAESVYCTGGQSSDKSADFFLPLLTVSGQKVPSPMSTRRQNQRSGLSLSRAISACKSLTDLKPESITRFLEEIAFFSPRLSRKATGKSCFFPVLMIKSV